jgi:hypothetical protein
MVKSNSYLLVVVIIDVVLRATALEDVPGTQNQDAPAIVVTALSNNFPAFAFAPYSMVFPSPLAHFSFLIVSHLAHLGCLVYSRLWCISLVFSFVL